MKERANTPFYTNKKVKAHPKTNFRTSIPVLISGDLITELDCIAKQNHCSRTKLIEKWIEEKLKKRDEDRQNQNLVLMAKIFQEIALSYAASEDQSLPSDSTGQLLIPGSEHSNSRPSTELLLIQWNLSNEK